MSIVLLALGLWGCGGKDLAGCEGQPEGEAREACRLQALQGLTVEQAEAAIDGLPDAASRDLLRVQLVVADPARYGPLCEGVRHRGTAEWCRDVLDRVHLHEPGPGGSARP